MFRKHLRRKPSRVRFPNFPPNKLRNNVKPVHLTLEELVKSIIIREGVDREENVSLIFEDNVFKVCVLTPEHFLESSGLSPFLAFKKMYQKLYHEPIIEQPNEYLLDSFERIIKKLSVLKQHIYILLLKNGKWEMSMKVPFENADVRGAGNNFNHALVFMHRTLADHGIEIKI